MKLRRKQLCCLILILLLTGCTRIESPSVGNSESSKVESKITVNENSFSRIEDIRPDNFSTENYQPDTNFDHLQAVSANADLSAVNWNGLVAFAEVNDNIPFFSQEERESQNYFENYSELDDFGRCGTAYANVCMDIMPTEDREGIGQIKPSGWHTSKYDKSIISDMYLYNRCHLIAYMLAGENANALNLITGTRYLNINGMLPFETCVHDYIEDNPNNHVLYRVTPMYKGDDLVAQGVLMEGWSVEDQGEGISYCVWCYNVQPQIEINYSNGENHFTGEKEETPKEALEADSYTYKYVLNENSKKIHFPDCSAVQKIAKDNYTETNRSYDELISQGYTSCGICHAK